MSDCSGIEIIFWLVVIDRVVVVVIKIRSFSTFRDSMRLSSWFIPPVVRRITTESSLIPRSCLISLCGFRILLDIGGVSIVLSFFGKMEMLEYANLRNCKTFQEFRLCG